MFALIPVLFAIALIVIITTAVVWTGGDVFGEGSTKASAQLVQNEAELLVNAIQLHNIQHPDQPLIDGSGNFTFQPLIDNRYLEVEPNLFADNNGVLVASPPDISNEDVCMAFNEAVGFSGPVPQCGSVPAELTAKRYYCCQ